MGHQDCKSSAASGTAFPLCNAKRGFRKLWTRYDIKDMCGPITCIHTMLCLFVLITPHPKKHLPNVKKGFKVFMLQIKHLRAQASEGPRLAMCTQCLRNPGSVLVLLKERIACAKDSSPGMTW